MDVSQLLSRLAKSELQNLALSENGEIVEASIAKVVGYIDEALLRLHSRFVLRQDDVLVEMVDGISTYELKAPYAMSYVEADGETPQPHKYIIDMGPKKFQDDVIRIIGAFDSLGHDMEMNNPMAPSSLFTPRPKVLQVPMPIPGQSLSVYYQAKHPPLDPGNLKIEIEIPEVMIGALTAYVGFLAFNGIGGPENMARAASHEALYSNICLEIEQKDGMGTETRSRSDVFEMRGFV